MKLRCECGGLIHDTTDGLPNKAELLADQDLFDLVEELEKAPSSSARALSAFTRSIYQCEGCGRLLVPDTEGRVHAFRPDEAAWPKILGSKRGDRYPVALSGQWKVWTQPAEGEVSWPTAGGKPGGFETFKDRGAFQARYYEIFEKLKAEGRLRSAWLHEGEKTLHRWPGEGKG